MTKKFDISKLDALFTQASTTAIEGYHLKNGDMRNDTSSAIIDKTKYLRTLDSVKLLPFASKVLDISADISDYIIQPIEIIRSEIPNRNGIGFVYEELAKYSYPYGRLAYQTWIGMPTYVEHQNHRTPDMAAGLILDVALRPAPEFKGNFYRLNQLLAFDRNKRPDVAAEILSGKRTGYSMGSLCDFYTCSICNTNVNDTGGFCEHIDVRTPQSKATSMRVIGNQLAFSIPRNINGIETSSVAVPAAPFAKNGDILMRPKDKPPAMRSWP